MSSYIYPMERILELRKGIENDRSNSLATKKKEVELKNREIDTLLDEYEQVKSNIIYMKSPYELTQVQLYRDRLADQIEKERGKLNGLHDEMENIKEDLIQARKDKMAIEKLKEKDYERFKDTEKKKEQGFLDEIASIRHTRNE